MLISGDVVITLCEGSVSTGRAAGNKVVEGCGLSGLAMIYFFRCDYKKAIEYHNRRLALAKETGDRATEGRVYGEIGEDVYRLGDLKAAIDHFNQELRIVKELKNTMYVRLVNLKLHTLFDDLGIAYVILGDSRKAVECHKQQLSIAKERKEKTEEGRAYRNLGNAYYHLCDFIRAIHYYNQQLRVAKEVGYRNEEGGVYENLGKAYYHLSDFQRAIEYFNLRLANAEMTGDKAGEGRAHRNLGWVYASLGDSRRAIDCHNIHLRIAKEVGLKAAEAQAYHGLGYNFELLGLISEALEYYRSSVAIFDDARDRLKSEDEWKLSLRNEYKISSTRLWRVLLKQGKIFEALIAAEKGRTQTLSDLVECRYGTLTSHPAGTYRQEDCHVDGLHELITSSTAFQAVYGGTMYIWVLSEGRHVEFRKHMHKLDNSFPFDWEAQAFYRLLQAAYDEIGVRDGVRCENRSLDTVRDNCFQEMSREESSQQPLLQISSLSTLYNIAIEPFADLVKSKELIIVPDGPSWLAPYAAFVDSDSKYLCESFRIRLIPSLKGLKMLSDSSEEYHSKNGALLVGDPWLAEVTDSEGEKLLEQLEFAKQEVEMIGEILSETPLTGKEATKAEVLKRLSSVVLVHIAAHGRMETGEIALSPNPERISSIPTKGDYVLTVTDLLNAQFRASLVVLSCFHSAREEIKAEGVAGIAHAFMSAGARSVLASLWAIDDEATLEFMRSFYSHLVQGKSASESLNQARKDLRESDKYSDVRYWAPFVLIGDDVTLKFDGQN